MITYKQGDLLNSDADMIAHGCNCVGGFGSGVAGAISAKYPEAREAYLEKHRSEGWELGDVQITEMPDGLFIANCATQLEYYPRDRVHANYDAIHQTMTILKNYACHNHMSIAIPKIGAGLAGGDWPTIQKILEEVFSDYDITVYYL